MIRLRELRLEKVLPYVLLVGSLICLIAAFALTYDKIQVLRDPTYSPSCNINPVLSCGSVMSQPQATVFGVPNTIFGLMGFSVLAALAALLAMGIQYPKRVWLLIQLGVSAGLAFTAYLFFQSVFRIHAICPFCFLVWVTMPPMFWYTLVYNIRQGHIPVKGTVKHFVVRHHGDVLIAWYLIFAAILGQRFWYYWSTLL